MEIKQEWWCDECGRHGAVLVEEGEGIWSVLRKIVDDHALTRHRCSAGQHKLRIHNATSAAKHKESVR